MLFSFAFIFFSLIAHISFSLSINIYYGFPLRRLREDNFRGNDPPTLFGLWRARKTYTTQTRNFRQEKSRRPSLVTRKPSDELALWTEADKCLRGPLEIDVLLLTGRG